MKSEPLIDRIQGKIADDHRSVNPATVLEPLCLQREEFNEEGFIIVNHKSDGDKKGEGLTEKRMLAENFVLKKLLRDTAGQ